MAIEDIDERMDPEEFLEKLQAGTFERDLVLGGMVKEDDDDDDVIQFSYGANCENWIKILTDHIESITMISRVPCGDHSHPFVELELKPPRTDEGELFADILRSMDAGQEGSQTGVFPTGEETFEPDVPVSDMPGGGHGPDVPSEMTMIGPGPSGPVGGGGGLAAWGCFPGWCSRPSGICRDSFGKWRRCNQRYRCTRCLWPW